MKRLDLSQSDPSSMFFGDDDSSSRRRHESRTTNFSCCQCCCFFLSVFLALEVRGYIEPEAGPVDPPMSTCQIYEDVCFEA